MDIKEINVQQTKSDIHVRPTWFDNYIGQKHIKNVLTKAIHSAHKREKNLWHILLSWPSWFGKTTLGQIIAHEMGSKFHIITGYAVSKPADIMSILTSLEENDILFIDEIHRLKPTIEEMLYIGMEDFAIDMVMPEWGNVRLPIKPFTLIGATTKIENLSLPFKNRFIYSFHFTDYEHHEKEDIIKRYLWVYHIEYDQEIISSIAEKIDSVPREIHNLCVKIRDYLVTHQDDHHNLYLGKDEREATHIRLQLQDGWLTNLHQKYLSILENAEGVALGVRTIALQLGINEKAVETAIEPLLLKLWKIEKTSKGRKLV